MCLSILWAKIHSGFIKTIPLPYFLRIIQNMAHILNDWWIKMKKPPGSPVVLKIIPFFADYILVVSAPVVSAGAIVSLGAGWEVAGADISVLVLSLAFPVLVPELQAATNIPSAMANTPTFNKFFITNGFFKRLKQCLRLFIRYSAKGNPGVPEIF